MNYAISYLDFFFENVLFQTKDYKNLQNPKNSINFVAD